MKRYAELTGNREKQRIKSLCDNILTFHNTLTKLKANFMTLKGTIGTSLMNLFKPIMVVVNNAIVVINQFAKAVGDSLGKILGWRYEVGSGAVEMSDMADYADDTASGLGKAGKAAQDLKRQLQGFDELNNLTSNDDNGGGGGSGGGAGGLGGGSAGDMAGKWVKEESLFESDWDTWFKLGRGISEAWTEGLNSINWNEVYKTFDNFGTGLAEFLNGLITPDLFGALGRTIAGSLNSALHFLNSFGTTFDWLNFGNSLAEGVNKFFDTFDFQLAGEAFSKFVKGGLDACIEFVDKTDFEKIGNGIADFIAELDLPGIIEKFGKLALKIIEALGEAIIGLGENNPLAAAIVGLIAITKLVGFGEAIGGAVDTATAGKTFSLKNTLIGIALTIGSIKLLNSYTDLTGMISAAAGIAIGGKMIGLSTKQSVGLGVTITGVSLVDDAGSIFSGTASTTEYLSKLIIGSLLTGAGALLLGASLPVAITVAVALGAVKFVGDFIRDFEAKIAEAAGFDELAEYFRNFHFFGEGGLFDELGSAIEDNVLIDALVMMVSDACVAVMDLFAPLGDAIKKALRSIPGGDLIAKALGIDISYSTAEWQTLVDNADMLPDNGFGNKLKENAQNQLYERQHPSWFTLDLGVNIPEETETKTQEAWNKISGIWKDDEADYTVDSNATPQQSILNNYTSRQGIWKNLISEFTVDPTKTSTNTITTEYNNRKFNWKDAISNFTVDPKKTSLQDINSALIDRKERWSGKSVDFKVDPRKTLLSDINNAMNDRKTRWTGKSVNFTVSPYATNISTIAEARNARQNAWTGKTVNYSINTGATPMNSVKAANSSYQAQWKDKVANYAISFGVDASKVNSFINSNVFAKINNTFAKIPILKGFNIPYLATGGITDKATIAMIGEAGTEAVVPLERNTQWLGKMANMLASEMEYQRYNPSSTSYSHTVSTPSYVTSGNENSAQIAEQNALLREQNRLLQTIAQKELTISEREVFNATRNASNNYYNRTGNSPFVF